MSRQETIHAGALTGQSSTPGLCLLDRPVEPGDDSEVCVNPSEKRSSDMI
jgi:hypothetical protein